MAPPDSDGVVEVRAPVLAALRFGIPALCCLVSFALWIACLAAPNSDGCALALVIFLLLASAARRWLPLLARVPGCLTYRRVNALLEEPRVPNNLAGHFCVATLIADAVLLPLAMLFASFHSVSVFSFFGMTLWPLQSSNNPDHASAVPFYLGFWIVPALGSALNLFVIAVPLSTQRCNPYSFSGTDKWTRVVRSAVMAAPHFLVPSLTFAYSALSCREGRARFGGGMRCASAAHRVHIVFGVAAVALAEAVGAAATAGGCRVLAGGDTDDLDKAARVDGAALETLLLLRSVVVVQGAFGVPPVLSAVLSAFALAYFFYRPASSVACLQTLIRCVFMTALVSSIVCLIFAGSWAPVALRVVLATAIIFLSFGAIDFWYVKNHGRGSIFVGGTDRNVVVEL